MKLANEGKDGCLAVFITLIAGLLGFIPACELGKERT